MGEEDVAVGESHGLVKREDVPGAARRQRGGGLLVADGRRHVSALREGASSGDGRLCSRFAPVEDMGNLPAAAESKEPSDCGTLWVDYDAHGERFKNWRTVFAESSEHVWSDYPFEGPPTCLYLSKHSEWHGGDPRRWMQGWAREKRRPHRRVVLSRLLRPG